MNNVMNEICELICKFYDNEHNSCMKDECPLGQSKRG